MTMEEKIKILIDKFDDEIDKYKQELCQKSAEEVWEHAYEIAIKNEMRYAIYDLDEETLDFVMAKQYSIDDFYYAWLDNDACQITHEVNECVEDFLYDEMQSAENEEGDED